MILKRILSLLIDLSIAAIAAGAMLVAGDFDFGLTISLLFAIGLTIETILTNGKSLGLLVCKIGPMHRNGKPTGKLKLIVYYFAFSVLLFNAFNFTTAAIVAFLVIIPFPVFNGQYSSGIDILFGIQWVEERKRKEAQGTL